MAERGAAKPGVEPAVRARSDAPANSADAAAGVTLGLLGVLIFGATLPVTRIALADFDPAFITFARAGLAAALAALALTLMRAPRPARGQLRDLALAGALLIYGFPGLMAQAMTSIPAAEGGVVLAILPVASAAFAALLGEGRASARLWASNLVGGALVLAFLYRDGGASLAAGHAWLSLAGLAAALGYVLFGRLTRSMPSWAVIAWAVLLAAPLSAVGSWASWRPEMVEAAPLSWIALAYLGAFPMFLGFFALNGGMARIGVARVTQLQLMQVFVTLALSALLLGETIETVTIGFAAAVALTLWLGQRG